MVALSWPALRGVDDSDDFNGFGKHAVDDDEGERRQGQFPRGFHTSGPAAIGKRLKAVRAPRKWPVRRAARLRGCPAAGCT